MTKRLLRRLLSIKHVTRFDSRAGVNCHVPLVDVSNDAFFIDHEGGAIAEALLFVEDAVIFNDGAFEIAEKWKGDANLFGEFPVSGNTVYTQAENLSVG